MLKLAEHSQLDEAVLRDVYPNIEARLDEIVRQNVARARAIKVEQITAAAQKATDDKMIADAIAAQAQ